MHRRQLGVDRRESVKQPTDILTEAEQYVRELYRTLLQRDPTQEELGDWAMSICNGRSDRDVFYRFVNCEEYRAKHRLVPGHAIGHYYSPVVDPSELTGPRRPRRNIAPDDILGIELSLEHMKEWWRSNLEVIKSTPFPHNESPQYRYYGLNNIYPFGDAVLLRAMILGHRPKHIIEIGSGFSSACMLDTIDEAELDTQLTLIEPHTERLRSRLHPGDTDRIRIIEAQVQDVPLDEFSALQAGDILFIDSSHVLKTGSDVHRELFEILPVLAEGTLMHFHDIGYPFEYPDEWIFERRYSWKEAYAVRAFLMHNVKYRVEFMASMFRRMAQDVIDETFPAFGEHPSGSLWVGKRGTAVSDRRKPRRRRA
jgi:predicted O-methyltransferase YrrM